MVGYENGLRREPYLNAYSVLNVISAWGGLWGHGRGGILFYGQVLGISIRDEFAVRCIRNKTHRVGCCRQITDRHTKGDSFATCKCCISSF